MKSAMIAKTRQIPGIVFASLCLAQTVFGSTIDDPTPLPSTTHGLSPAVLVGLAVMLILAKLAGEMFERLGQPAVLGELIGGIALGNLLLFGITWADALKTNDVIAALADIGVIVLLFEVGLESDLKEMLAVGWSSLLVAVLGVIAPFVLGWMVSAYFMPHENQLVHVFIGATLCATSVGITARVFKDLDRLSTREARIILGAAVIDDVLGLIILAVVVGTIKAANGSGDFSILAVVYIIGKALLFMAAAVALGHLVVPRLLRTAGRLETRGVLLTLAISFCFFLSWAAAKVGLAAIVGAFAAGLVLDEVHYKPTGDRQERDLHDLLQPVSTFLVPVFFVSMGLKVDLAVFGHTGVLAFAFTLTVVAILGKQICAAGVLQRGLNRVAVGLGMIPRGEVGLIFAGIGATLVLPDQLGRSAPVIGTATFGAVVIMIIVTTLVTPPALKWALGRGAFRKAGE